MSLFGKNKKDFKLPSDKKEADLYSKELNSLLSEMKQRVRTEFNTILRDELNKFKKDLSGAGEEVARDIREKAKELTEKHFYNFSEKTKQEFDELHQLFDKELEDIKKDIEKTQNKIEESGNKTLKSISDTYKDIQQKKATARQEAEKDAEKYKKQLFEELDSKLNNAVKSFLVENLGNALDPDQQSNYIFKMLDENKEEIKKNLDV